jgi:hypothetical protein
MWQLLVFAGALLFFHASEFLLAAIFMRDELSKRCEWQQQQQQQQQQFGLKVGVYAGDAWCRCRHTDYRSHANAHVATAKHMKADVKQEVASR